MFLTKVRRFSKPVGVMRQGRVTGFRSFVSWRLDSNSLSLTEFASPNLLDLGPSEL